MAGLLGWLALHAAIGAAGTWLARRYALSRRLLDEPSERRSHVVATARGGGVSIVVALLVALCALGWRMPAAVPWLAPTALGLLAVSVVGWVDDHRPLSPWSRLCVHALAAALLGLACLLAGTGLAGAVFGAALALVLVNVWNFMDGIDGLAASQALLAAVALAWVLPSGPAWWLALALAAACAGFLPFNFPRARIFLGDVGSGALGYALAAVVALSAGTPVGWAWLLLPLSAFLIDAALTLAARMVRNERWWTPHVTHLYQRLARGWRSHRAVTLAYAAWTVCGAILMGFVRMQHALAIMCAVVVWYLLGMGVWIVLRHHDPVQVGATQ